MVRYTNEHGEDKVEDEHLDLLPDLANGLIITVRKNVRRDALPLSVSLVVATPKPRLVKVTMTVAGTEPFSVAGSARKATHYVLKIDIGGIAGLVAPLIRKTTAGFPCLDTRRAGPGVRSIAGADVHGGTGVADGPRESGLATRTMSRVDVGLVVCIEDARR